MNRKKVYVIANSHMDPIWLWRLREGRSTWINTCRTVVRMLKKYPFLKFVRSSSVCYRWIEDCDKALFKEIVKLVDAERWELVGGWVEQSDTIITPGESLLRQAEHAKTYFRDKFGRDVRIAYSVDSFGQNAGLPQILKKTGFDYYTYMRPMAHEKTMPDTFRWQCTGGAGEILAFRIRNAYSTPLEIHTKEHFAEWVEKSIQADTSSIPVLFFGVGDHGGGIYENQLNFLLGMQDRYDLEFCTLAYYFELLEKKKLPVLNGEMTHHSPGCYSTCSEIKEWMADCEKNLYKAEKLNLQIHSPDQRKESEKLYEAWDKLLFNYFHDVYSGTCIGDSYRHEIRDICGAVNNAAVDSMERSLCRIGSAIPSSSFVTEGGVLLWNPHSFQAQSLSEFDACKDPNMKGEPFNALKTADGREIPLQWIRGASTFGPGPWGRAVVLDKLGPSEVRVYAYARSGKKYPALGVSDQKKFLKDFSLEVLDDKGDTWGHNLKRLGENIGSMKLVKTEERENGPVVSCLRAEYTWKDSSIVLDIFQYAGIEPLRIKAHCSWNEKDSTVKAVLKTDKKICSTVSGQASAILRRTTDACEQPFLDWVAADHDNGSAGKTGFLAHALHGYDVMDKKLRLTLLRPVLYAEHNPIPASGEEGYADVGTSAHEFWAFAGTYTDAECAHLACERLWTAEHFEITAAKGNPRFRYDRWEVTPESVTVQSERILTDGTLAFTLLNQGGKAVSARILRNSETLKTIRLKPGELVQTAL